MQIEQPDRSFYIAALVHAAIYLLANLWQIVIGSSQIPDVLMAAMVMTSLTLVWLGGMTILHAFRT